MSSTSAQPATILDEPVAVLVAPEEAGREQRAVHLERERREECALLRTSVIRFVYGSTHAV